MKILITSIAGLLFCSPAFCLPNPSSHVSPGEICLKVTMDLRNVDRGPYQLQLSTPGSSGVWSGNIVPNTNKYTCMDPYKVGTPWLFTAYAVDHSIAGIFPKYHNCTIPLITNGDEKKVSNLAYYYEMYSEEDVSGDVAIKCAFLFKGEPPHH